MLQGANMTDIQDTLRVTARQFLKWTQKSYGKHVQKNKFSNMLNKLYHKEFEFA